jgi:hypothetical protein
VRAPPLLPLVTSTLPELSRVAVCWPRPVAMVPAGDQEWGVSLALGS